MVVCLQHPTRTAAICFRHRGGAGGGGGVGHSVWTLQVHPLLDDLPLRLLAAASLVQAHPLPGALAWMDWRRYGCRHFWGYSGNPVRSGVGGWQADLRLDVPVRVQSSGQAPLPA